MKSQTAFASILTLPIALMALGKSAQAQTLQWKEVPTATEGCATSISVAPNNVPIVTGCGGADNWIYYLANGGCSVEPCFQYPVWQHIPGLSAARVVEDLDGEIWAITSAGAVYYSQGSGGPGTTVTYSQFSSFGQIVASDNICISSLAPGPVSTYGEVDVSPPMYGAISYVMGLGCTHEDRYGENAYVWNLNMGSWGYSASPGWQPLSISAAQIVLFTGQDNIQVPWIRTSYQGTMYSDNGAGFQAEPGNASWLTDHYCVGESGAYVYGWDDGTEQWALVASATTSNGTKITQIAHAGAITTGGNGVVGPSGVWGIDNVGHIFQLVSAGGPSQ